MANSKLMSDAKSRKDDEYYTLYDDISNELPLYKDQFRNKRVICPCDWDESFEEQIVYSDGSESFSNDLFSDRNFVKDINIDETKKSFEKKIDLINCNFVRFLVAHAEDYGIKSISVSGYNPKNDDGIRFQDIDYSKYDLVITNPPFSQITEFFDVMIKNKKQFLVIGPQTALGYKDSFCYIRENKMWLGYAKQLIGFGRPNGDVLLSKNPEGSVPRACKWFTNLDVSYRHDEIILTEKYDSKKYIHYDNFDGIDVGKVSDIPYDYEGAIGVPITFIQKYNPNQFEILGLGSGDSAKELGIKKNYRGRTDLAYTKDGKQSCPFGRILIRNKKVRKDED